MSIVVDNITKVYGKQKAIDSISFTVQEGEILGLLGPNGAGKTTTMKILTGFMPPTSGQATILGMDVAVDNLEVRKIIGYLPEHNPLYGSMFVKEFLHFICRVHGMSNAAERVNSIIEEVGLVAEKSKKISQLSKGYKQRVGLAQAIIHDPKVLILDEPISGLDPNQLVEIRSLISKLKSGRTIIFSSHILQEVESVCDRIVILNNGRIVADDKIKELNLSSSQRFNIQVKFLKPIKNSELMNHFSQVKVQTIKDGSFVISSAKDIRSEIFDYAVEKGNKLLELRILEQSLESVFKSVTKS